MTVATAHLYLDDSEDNIAKAKEQGLSVSGHNKRPFILLHGLEIEETTIECLADVVVREVSIRADIPRSPWRERGIYQSKDSATRGEVEIVGDNNLIIEIRGSDLAEAATLLKAIRAGTIFPTESYEDDQVSSAEQTRLYKLMSHYAVAALHFYRKDIVPLNEGENLGLFAEKNQEIIKRVCDEALSLFNYELSHAQIGQAVGAYTATGLSVTDTEVGGSSISTS